MGTTLLIMTYYAELPSARAWPEGGNDGYPLSRARREGDGQHKKARQPGRGAMFFLSSRAQTRDPRSGGSARASLQRDPGRVDSCLRRNDDWV